MTAHRKPWEVPERPRCGSRVFVDRYGGGPGDWICHDCDEVFQAEVDDGE